MEIRRFPLAWIAVMTVVAAVSVGRTEESTDEARQAEVAVMVKTVAAKCQFSSGGNASTAFVQQPDPILRWSNPTAGSVFGDVYVWTDNGRPVVVAGAYRWFSPDWGDTLETCSLAEAPVSGRKNEVTFWNPDKPGMRFQPITDVDPPAKTSAGRLVQMRRISDDFIAQLADTRGTDVGVKRQLRILSRPVFRYPAPVEKSEYIDGSLFVFVEGTDPEVLLLVEAVDKAGGPAWQFGIARMNRDELQVTYRSVTVWTAPYLEDVMGRTREPYAMFVLRTPLQDKRLNAGPAKGKAQ